MSNIKISIKDFQSLKNVELELVPGLNLVVGKTNIGKTAVIRAVDAAIFNSGNDELVRSGQNYCGVFIDNGKHKMSYARSVIGKNEKTAYQFDDGVVHRKVGRNQLPEVSDYFGIRDVRMQNGVKVKLNFWYQNDKPFLMDKTSGQLYEFLSLSSCDKYSKVLKTMQTDEKVLKAEINSVTAEIDTYKMLITQKQDFVDNNEGYDKVYLSAIELSQRDKKLKTYISLVKELIELRELLKQKIDKLNKIKNKLVNLDFVSLSNSYNSVNEEVDNVITLIGYVRFLKDTKFSITNKVNYLNSKKFSLLSVNVDECGNLLNSFINRHQTFVLYSKGLKGLFDDSEILNKKLNSLNNIKNSFYLSFKEDSEKVDKLKSNYKSLKEFGKILKDVSSLNDKVVKKEKDLLCLEIKIKKSDEDFESLKLEAGYCPFCGTIFTEDKCLGGN